LEQFRGRHTELVSVYVPAGYNINESSSQISNEQSTASNIKSKSTKKNVMTALEKIVRHLKLFKKTPPNGLVVFCGNVSGKEGEADIKLWSIEPPMPMNQKIYWCGQTFVLDPLRDLTREKEVYGLIVMDTNEGDIGLLIGKKIQVQRHIDSLVPGKTTKGGWSQQRYARIREEAKHDYMKKLGEAASDIFKKEKDLKGVIIGGPGPLKEKFNGDSFLDYQIKGKVLGVVDTSYTGMPGLHELVERGEDLIKEASAVRERHLMENFFGHLQKDDGLAVYGIDEVKQALEYGAVNTLLISEEFDWLRVKLKCSCGHLMERDTKPDKKHFNCPKCGNEMTIEDEVELVDILSDKAKGSGTEVEIVSTETREGVQFKELGGVGGILRFRI